MNRKAFQKIKETLSDDGRRYYIEGQPIETILSRSRITPATQLPPMEHLFTLYGSPCFFRGELVANCGKAKSGKTLFLSIIMACSMKRQVLGLARAMPDSHADDTDDSTLQPLRVLWLDTEQSAQSTQDIMVNRIRPLAEQFPDDDAFFAYNLRGYGYEARRTLMEYAINKLTPDLVIIDGIKDLVTDINDAVQATLIMEQLMALAQRNNCCIVNVLHMNKSETDKNMRGSIGTELTNKAFEVFQCEYLEENDVFKVKHALSRKHRIRRKMYYTLDKEGLPVECDTPNEQPRDAQGRWAKKQDNTDSGLKLGQWDKLNPKYYVHKDDDTYEWNLSSLFSDAFEGRSSRQFNQVMGAALRLSHIESPKLYYALFNEAERRGIIRSVKHPETGDTHVEFCENQLSF